MRYAAAALFSLMLAGCSSEKPVAEKAATATPEPSVVFVVVVPVNDDEQRERIIGIAAENEYIDKVVSEAVREKTLDR